MIRLLAILGLVAGVLIVLIAVGLGVMRLVARRRKRGAIPEARVRRE